MKDSEEVRIRLEELEKQLERIERGEGGEGGGSFTDLVNAVGIYVHIIQCSIFNIQCSIFIVLTISKDVNKLN